MDIEGNTVFKVLKMLFILLNNLTEKVNLIINIVQSCARLSFNSKKTAVIMMIDAINMVVFYLEIVQKHKYCLFLLIQPIMNILSLLIHSHVVPNLYDFFLLWKIKGDILRHVSKLFGYQEFVFHRKKSFRFWKFIRHWKKGRWYTIL